MVSMGPPVKCSCSQYEACHSAQPHSCSQRL